MRILGVKCIRRHRKKANRPGGLGAKNLCTCDIRRFLRARTRELLHVGSLKISPIHLAGNAEGKTGKQQVNRNLMSFKAGEFICQSISCICSTI
jgi:hypothetical protein